MEKILNEYIDKAFEELVADTQGRSEEQHV